MPDPVRPAFATFFTRLLLSRPNHPNRLNALARETPQSAAPRGTAGAETPQSRKTRRPRTRSRFTATTLGATMVAATLTGSGIVGGPTPSAHAATPQRQASGWITYWDSNGVPEVAANADLFTDVSEFQFSATGATTIVPSSTASAAQLTSAVATIRQRGVPVTITVTDGTGQGGMSSIMSNPTTRVQHEQALLALAQKYGANGIDLDYENMAFNTTSALVNPTRAGFDALVHELAVALHKRGMMLAVDVVSKTSEPGTSMAQQVYDYPTLGKWADRFRIMTYDQHYAGSAYPGGPISGIPWVQSILSFATTVVPASKIFMGVPLYGYDWSSAGGRATGVTFTRVKQLVQQYHATPQWSSQDGEPYFTYTDAGGAKHTVWYNDAKAVQARLPLVGKYGLGGVAFWSFGSEDPGVWQVMRTFMYGPNPFGNIENARLWPGGVRVSGWAIDPNSTAPINVDLYVDGKMAGRIPASTDRPDVGNVYYFYGTQHGYDGVIPVPAGRHQICAYGINVGAGTANPQLGCLTVYVPTNNPQGNLEVATGKYGVLSVGGWALDPDTAGPVAVHFYVDGRWAGMTTAAGDRADIANAFPGWGPAHGFSASMNVAGGTHTVCAYAINTGLGTTNPRLGCFTLSVTSGNPFGNFEGLTVGAGTLTASGWTIDPNDPAPINVAVYVDGKLATEATANTSRPDVGAAYPTYGANHGFTVSANASAGQHQVCVYALNAGPGDANPSLGCRTVVVPTANPMGHLDAATGGSGQVTASGWTLDPNTPAPIDVAIYIDGHVATQAQANLLRPDIAVAFPGYGANHGFSVHVAATPGPHQLCAFGLNTGAGDANTYLGCAAVTVS